VQRTRSSPSVLRSPLTRSPLGDTKFVGWLTASLVLAISCQREPTKALLPTGVPPSVVPSQVAQLVPTAAIYKVGGDVTAPTVLSPVRPDTPEKCKMTTVIGVFIFEETITETGDVVDVKTLKAPELKPPCPELEEACKKAILASKYKPAMRGGQPVAVYLTTTVLFHADGR
jgi:hypothetical protein